MQTKEYDLSIENNEFVKIKQYLLDSDGGFSYYAKHVNDMKTLEQFADDDSKVKDFIEKNNKILSIDEVLPLTFSNTYEVGADDIVSIYIFWGDTDDCNYDNMCLIVDDYTGKNHDKALTIIREAGFNPEDYEIVFREGGE